MSDSEGTATPAADPPGSGAVEVPEAAAAATTTAAGGVTFNFDFNNVTYTVQLYAPDSNGQYGFTITQGANTIASLIYKDGNDWAIVAGLPSALQVDTNLTVSKFNININKGAVITPP